MKLYEVPRNTWVKIKYDDEEILFDHIDGAYSYCLLHGDKDLIIHLHASTEVEIIKKPTKDDTIPDNI